MCKPQHKLIKRHNPMPRRGYPAFAISGSPLPTQKPAFGLLPSPANLIKPVVALPSLDTDSFVYSVAAVCSDGWACRKHLCFSPEPCIPQRRLSLLRRVSQAPQPLAAPQAECSMWCSSAQDYSSSWFSQAIQPLVRPMQDGLLHTAAPQRCRESSSARLRAGRMGPALSKVGSGDADVVLPRTPGDRAAVAADCADLCMHYLTAMAVI